MTPHLKTLSMPLAMVAGVLFPRFFAGLNGLTPYLIFTMLLVTFARTDWRAMRPRPMHAVLLMGQLLLGVLLYVALRPLNEVVAEGAMICVLAPVAMAAVVIAGMLGADLACVATFSLLSNLVAACTLPFVFSWIGAGEVAFFDSFVHVASRVGPLLVLPFLVAQGLRRLTPRVGAWLSSHGIISFYAWLAGLAIVAGRTVCFMREQPAEHYGIDGVLALVALLVCLVQFGVGRRVGRRWGDAVAGGQSFGQKNTILAIWMTQTWLNPLASVAPAAYIVWQNIVNSYQLWRKDRER